MATDETGGIRIVRTETVAEDKWLVFNAREFIDREGRPQSWSYVSRRGGREAVLVAARLPERRSLVLIRQFRVPLAAWVYEFPAGLIDPGEGPAEAALRELAEETGYRGGVRRVSPALPTSSGLSTETVYLVEVECAGEPGPTATEGAEAIEIVLVDEAPAGIAAFLSAAARDGALVDAKLYAWLGARL